MAMVVAMDAVGYAAERERLAGWQAEIGDRMADAELRLPEAGVLAPARGMICGLLLSGAIWVGIVVAVRAMLAQAR